MLGKMVGEVSLQITFELSLEKWVGVCHAIINPIRIASAGN